MRGPSSDPGESRLTPESGVAHGHDKVCHVTHFSCIASLTRVAFPLATETPATKGEWSRPGPVAGKGQTKDSNPGLPDSRASESSCSLQAP